MRRTPDLSGWDVVRRGVTDRFRLAGVAEHQWLQSRLAVRSGVLPDGLTLYEATPGGVRFEAVHFESRRVAQGVYRPFGHSFTSLIVHAPLYDRVMELRLAPGASEGVQDRYGRSLGTRTAADGVIWQAVALGTEFTEGRLRLQLGVEPDVDEYSLDSVAYGCPVQRAQAYVQDDGQVSYVIDLADLG